MWCFTMSIISQKTTVIITAVVRCLDTSPPSLTSTCTCKLVITDAVLLYSLLISLLLLSIFCHFSDCLSFIFLIAQLLMFQVLNAAKLSSVCFQSVYFKEFKACVFNNSSGVIAGF